MKNTKKRNKTFEEIKVLMRIMWNFGMPENLCLF